VTKDGVAFEDPQLNGQLLSWFIDDENICKESMYIEFDALVTNEGEDYNLLVVTSEYCNPEVDKVYANDTVYIDAIDADGNQGSIRGIKFNDSNSNGIKDCDEDILEDWTIELYRYVDSDWILQETMETTSSGYEFDELSAGEYKVREETKQNWINITAEKVIVSIDGEIETIDFGNKYVEPDDNELSIKKLVKLPGDSVYQNDGVHVDYTDDDWVNFKIIVQGTGTFDSVTVEDSLPPELISHDDLIWHLESEEVSWSETIYFNAEIINDFKGNITNTATITGTYNCDQVITDSDEAWVDIDRDEPEEILTVEKLVKPDCEECSYQESISFDISDEVDFVTYKVNVHIDDLNGTFNEPIEDLSIRDNLPQLSGLQYNDSFIKNEDGSFFEEYTIDVTEDYIYWNFTSYVMPGTNFTLEYCANVIGCGDFENQVNLTARYYDSPCCWRDLYANASAHVEVICGPGIDVTKEASLDGITWKSDSVTSFVDDTVWFRLTVENTGYEVLEGVNVLDYLPDFLVFDEMIDDGDASYVNTSCENYTYDLRWFFTEIDIGETIEIVFTTTVIDVGVDDNHVVAYDCPDEGEESVGDDDRVEICVEEGLHVEKQVYDDTTENWTENISILPGEIIQWKVTLSFYSSNTSQIMHHIMINDTLPEELTYVNDSAEFIRKNGSSFDMNPSIDGNLLTWNLNEEFLLNEEWLTLTFETKLDSDAETGLLENNVDITGRVCNGTYYVGTDSATVFVTEIQNVAPEILDRSPENGATEVDIDAVLEVTVDDAEDDELTVTFYNASDDSVIEEISNIDPQKTVDTMWENLEYNTTYEWYVTVSDDNQTNTSAVWNFTTIDEPTNQAPDEPTNPSPADNAQGVIVNPTLSVHVSDPDGDELDVTFYDASTDQQIGSDQCTSDCTASTTWSGLVKDTSY
ncbi:MAG: isopeptide-forming domain-containing fimbrial protein, partial [Candidatus Thermoplasmatota archaeon]|nr:isopeptide-forming domain-containing fimbrial protein [Candidatus Thermoplasmatota archaeon]